MSHMRKTRVRPRPPWTWVLAALCAGFSLYGSSGRDAAPLDGSGRGPAHGERAPGAGPRVLSAAHIRLPSPWPSLSLASRAGLEPSIENSVVHETPSPDLSLWFAEARACVAQSQSDAGRSASSRLSPAPASDSQNPALKPTLDLPFLLVPSLFETDACTSPDSPAARATVTLFTQASVDRHHLIYDTVASWVGGRVSLALFIGSAEELRGLGETLLKFHETLSADPRYRKTCLVLSLCFAQQLSADLNVPRHPYDHSYPVNVLRNLALEEARTPWVLSLDIDFIPSADLYARLLASIQAHKLLAVAEARPSVFVLPAFEMTKRFAFPVPYTLEAFQADCRAMRVLPFHAKPIATPPSLAKTAAARAWCEGLKLDAAFLITDIHFLTNYTRALGLLSQPAPRSHPYVSPPPYPVDKAPSTLNKFYEPYFVALAAHVPPFPEAFRGYSFNKRAHNILLQYQGLAFWVLPAGLVVHRWHPPSASKRDLKGILRATVGRIYEAFLRDLAASGGATGMAVTVDTAGGNTASAVGVGAVPRTRRHSPVWPESPDSDHLWMAWTAEHLL